MGEILCQVRKELGPNGRFWAWVEHDAGLPKTTGWRLIRIHESFERSTLERTPIATSALYALAGPSTPPAARQEALDRAQNGETISRQDALKIVQKHNPTPPSPPPLPPRPVLPPRPGLPDPEYRAFEREELLPRLHDAGNPDAPQMLSGDWEEPPPVPEARKAQAITSMRAGLTEAVLGTDTGDEEAIEACVDEILEILGEGTNSNAICMQIGVALSGGPLPLADLVALSATVCGRHVSEMDRTEYLGLRKKVLRILDSLTLAGCGIYEHKLGNGQLVYALMPCEKEEDNA